MSKKNIREKQNKVFKEYITHDYTQQNAYKIMSICINTFKINIIAEHAFRLAKHPYFKHFEKSNYAPLRINENDPNLMERVCNEVKKILLGIGSIDNSYYRISDSTTRKLFTSLSEDLLSRYNECYKDQSKKEFKKGQKCIDELISNKWSDAINNQDNE